MCEKVLESEYMDYISLEKRIKTIRIENRTRR